MVLTLFISSINIIPVYLSLVLQGLSLLCIFLIFICLIFLRFFKLKYILFSMLFVLPILLSQIYNINNDSNFSRFYLLVIIYPVLFLIFLYISKSYKIYEVFKPFFFVIMLIVLLSVIKILGIYEFKVYNSNDNAIASYQDVLSRDYVTGYSGIYLNQNIFAPVLMVGFFTNLIFYFYSKSNIYRCLSVIFCIICGVLLLLTAARAPIASMILGVGLFYILSNITLKAKFLIFTIIFIVVGFYYNYAGEYFEILLSKFNSAGYSNRDVIWNDVFYNIKNNLIFGVGLGNYSFLDGYHVYSTHNVYLMFLVSLGFLGSLSIFLTIIIFLSKSFSIVLNKNQDIYVTICFVILISFLIHQFFEVILDNPLKPFAFFLLLVASYFYKDKTKEIEL